MEVTWGFVTAVSPGVEVRFPGDQFDVPIGLKADGLSLSVDDKVALVRLGSGGGWCILAVVAST